MKFSIQTKYISMKDGNSENVLKRIGKAKIGIN